MTFPANPYERSPKGDHNRRLSLGLDADEFAAIAGVSLEELKHYEFADTQEISDPAVAQKVGQALEQLEASIVPKVDNGPVPHREDEVSIQIYTRLQSSELGQRLALADIESAQQLIASELTAADPAAQLLSVGERARGPMRELIVAWTGGDGDAHEEVVVLPMQS